MGSILSLLGLGFGFLPMIVAGVALIDAFRVRADWYWFMVILAFPIVGSIAYFVVVRSPLLGTRNASMMSPTAARRLQARRRLRELQIQLNHWRGPAVLAEAGEELVVLGKPQEAEKLLRESQENGGAVEDVNFPLAQALEMQGRWAEAVPLLEVLCKAEPDARLGMGPLNLGRCLDEAGRKAEAEAVLRKVLERRMVIEAQVRLARILLADGRKEEAGQIFAEVRTDAKLLPRYLKREQAARLPSPDCPRSGGGPRRPDPVRRLCLDGPVFRQRGRRDPTRGRAGSRPQGNGGSGQAGSLDGGRGPVESRPPADRPGSLSDGKAQAGPRDWGVREGGAPP
jgi:hypothetical protein